MNTENHQALLALIKRAQEISPPTPADAAKDITGMLAAIRFLLENPQNQQPPFYFEAWFHP